ncbi:MAG TPA: hypothetical protein VM840_01065 [Actinomycetota bacterium]|nr:hypothetical protein [Actinomycetota bacterium]
MSSYGNGQMESGATELLERAVRAVRRGSGHDLEAALTALRQVDPEQAVQAGDRLRAMLACVRAHPSYAQAARRAAS